MKNYPVTIDLRLFATLAANMPVNAAHFPIETGMTVARLLERLAIRAPDVKLIFVNGVKGHLDTALQGGERVGLFPPVGGG